MDYVKDIVGNKVHIGDEVIYTAYRDGSFERGVVTKVHTKSVTIKLVKHNYLGHTYIAEKPYISRFIKIVKEES